MVTLAEALAEEAVAYMWCMARTDNHAFDTARLGIQAADDAGFEGMSEAEHEWHWSVEPVAGALADAHGVAAAELLWHLVQDRLDGGFVGPTVPEAVAITQAVFSPRRAYDRLPDDGDDAHGLPHE